MCRVVWNLIYKMNNIEVRQGWRKGIFWLQRIINARIGLRMVVKQPSLENLKKRMDSTLPVVFEI